jgi:predicted ArsR family transcriptional regulator
MNYSWEFANTPAGRVLKAIQLRGKASIRDVAADLGVTASAVRPQLSQLEATGAIRADKVRDGVGRPYHVYSVTPRAHDLFYRDDYGDLARFLLAEVVRMEGPEVLEGVLRHASARLALLYRDRIRGQDLAERVRAWAELLGHKGVAAEFEKTEEGYVVREHGCPYQSIAVENRAVCELESQVMSDLLKSEVRRTQCALDGYSTCQFMIGADSQNVEAGRISQESGGSR